MPEIKISVVIPSFRRPALLKRCLERLLNQTAKPDCYEVIVVTDGPDPETTGMIEHWTPQPDPGKLRIYSLVVKSGPAAARNLGWQKATGRGIIFTDDDCLPDLNLVSAYRKAFRKNPGYAFTGQVIVPVNRVPTDYEKNIGQLQTADFITANCGISKVLLEQLGGFDESFPGAWREDSDFHFKLLKHAVPIAHLQNAMVVHPVRPASWGVCLREEKKNYVNALLYRKHPDLYRRHISSGPSWNYYIMLISAVTGLSLLLTGISSAGIWLVAVWLAGAGLFASKRLSGTSRRPGHVIEMIATSVVIPFFSVYWSLYGAVKYKVFFLN